MSYSKGQGDTDTEGREAKMIYHLIRNAEGERETVMSDYDAEYLRTVADDLREMTFSGDSTFYTIEIDF